MYPSAGRGMPAWRPVFIFAILDDMGDSSAPERAGSAAAKPLLPLSWYGRMGWVGLIVLGAFPVLASLTDLSQDVRGALPADHLPTFLHVAHESYTAFSQSNPAAAHYVHLLEVGYAVHELVFGLLFLAIVVWPLRGGRWWAWVACWAVLVADIAYSLTFGVNDRTILVRSLVANILTPICLILVAASFVFCRRKSLSAK